MNIYKTVFIIPKKAKRILTNNGWIFQSNKTLPPSVTCFLVESLNLRFDEEYLGIMSYSNSEFQAVVSLNDSNEIEYVQIKVYGNYMELLLRAYENLNLDECAELFVP